ncbi:hypothetical protein DRP05_10165 [Archaeoglobales archaeon]|nr:MAG: hypothetical protein DRP05_10165 [Archaeoglobales archaeon]
MPAEFAKKLKPLKQNLQYAAWQNRIMPKRWGNRTNQKWIRCRVDSNALRKWFENFCLENGVEYEFAEYFMGHSLKGMGARHYAQMRKLSWDRYRKLLDKFPI